MYIGIEIGGTKLQLGIGLGDRHLTALWRGEVDAASGGPGIRRRIVEAIPELIKKAGIDRERLIGIGVGFGGPTDDATQSVIKSHHIVGWDGFPLAEWLREQTGLPTIICNDADVAGLAESHFGAGQGYSPVFYMTIGTGIGGGLTIDGTMYRGCGRGAVEVGHLLIQGKDILESHASGWGIATRARECLDSDPRDSLLRTCRNNLTTKDVAEAARRGDSLAIDVLETSIAALAEAIQQVVKLLCPRRIVIGGGVSLMGEELFFAPLRRRVEADVFPPFRGMTEIVPAALGEEVVVYGALLLARNRFQS